MTIFENLGLTPFPDYWQNNVAPVVNSFFSSGPLSPTKQTITMNQTVNFPPVQQRNSNTMNQTVNFPLVQQRNSNK